MNEGFCEPAEKMGIRQLILMSLQNESHQKQSKTINKKR